MKKSLQYLIFVLLCSVSNLLKAQSDNILQGALRPERTCFDVIHYDLQVEIMMDKQRIKGNNAISFKVLETTQRIQLDLYKNLHIDSVVFEDKKLKFKRKHHAFFIDFPTPLTVDAIKIIKVYYHGKPQSFLGNYNDKGFQWLKDDNNNPFVGVSCESVGASVWFPNKDHLSDEPDSARLSWTLPANFTCISNGVLEKITLDSLLGKKTWLWTVKNPINNYNITFYIGKYKELSLPYADKKQLICYYYGNDEQAKEFFQPAIEMVKFCEKMFGEYPYWNEKFAIVQAPFRGMEHQTCINIGGNFNYENWAYPFLVPYKSILIHEIAHEWWGNAVSVGDIADMWLHEGFATYTEILFIESLYGYEAYEKTIQNLQNHVVEGSVLGQRHIYDNTFRSYNIYGKGAKVLHLLRLKIANDELFFAILKDFQTKYRHKIVYTEDFIKMVNEKTGQDFTKYLMDLLLQR
jgi:aminopeptidase N